MNTIKIQPKQTQFLLAFCNQRVMELHNEVKEKMTEIESIQDIIDQIDETQAEESINQEKEDPSDFYNAAAIDTESDGSDNAAEENAEAEKDTASDQPGFDTVLNNFEKTSENVVKREPKNKLAKTVKQAQKIIGVPRGTKRGSYKKTGRVAALQAQQPKMEDKPKREAPAVYSNRRSLYPELNESQF